MSAQNCNCETTTRYATSVEELAASLSNFDDETLLAAANYRLRGLAHDGKRNGVCEALEVFARGAELAKRYAKSNQN